MISFEIQELRKNTVLYLYSQRHLIWVDPPYQRQGDIWNLEKKQLLMDSILNGFDIPKLYFRDYGLLVPGDKEVPTYRYAIIDGRQRLTSIWDFMDGRFPLSDSFEAFRGDDIKAHGLTYRELSEKYPSLLVEFDQAQLPVITLITNDEEIVEDMFSRLNEAVSLSAAEKRNAFGGPLPAGIRRLVAHPFFTQRLPFSNSRYRHFDLASKMLLFEHRSDVTDTKKVYLDELVKGFKSWAETDEQANDVARELENAVRMRLDHLASMFVDDDPLLRPVGMISIYYLAHMFNSNQLDDKIQARFNRAALLRFEEARTANKAIAQRDLPSARYDLLEFDRLAQSPNDEVALQYRLKVLRHWVLNS